jgi:hypothetical protein
LIYICIPTHNEQQTVGVVLWKLRQVLTEFPRDYQLLVADDASTDKTIEVLEPYTRVLPLTVISSRQRQGYAASLEMLLREAVRRSEYPKRDVIVTLQADFSEEPEDVVALIKRMEAGADVAVGIKVRSVPESRVRRLARTLSSFFARRQKWPEGVVTPFDGYRAYRLQAVKRAIEERGDRRLVHYDGWAAHAELLGAVLPHARRVDALEVEDRADRLQRPRRERPLAAAWQVRAMASGHEPPGLVSVEELDQTAATASRSRERALLAGVTAGQPRPVRGAAAPDRARSGRDRQERGRGERRPRGDAPRSDAPRERPPRVRSAEAADGQRGRRRPETASEASQERKSPREGQEASRRKRQEPRSRPPRQVEEGQQAAGQLELPADPATAEALMLLTGIGEAAPAPAAPKKRRRRRRSRSTGEAAGQQDQAEESETAAEQPPGEEPGEEGGAEAAVEGAAPTEKKRRRRGGRGRRRGRREGAPESDGAGADGDGAGGDGAGGDGASSDGADETGRSGGTAGEGSADPAGEAV